jgi:hypothetical protein
VTVEVDDQKRATLAALADVLIPNAEGMPAASEVDVQGKWLDRVLTARPDIASALIQVLADAQGIDPTAAVRRLQETDAVCFAALGLTATGAYYMSPKVRKLIGYPGQKPNAPYPDEAEFYLRDGLLDPVSKRGPIFRPTPRRG